MRGRNVNFGIDAGRAETLTIKPMKEGGEAWVFSGITVSGALRDIKTDETVERLECGVTSDGKITINFPARESGQYVFVVDISGEDGGVTRLIDGYVTWGEPRAVITEGEESDEQCLLVYVEGKRRKAVWAWSNEAERMYEAARDEAEKAADSAERAEKAAESVNGAVQLKLLNEFNEALKEFDSKVSNAIRIDDKTNTWWIAGVNKGVQATGDKGEPGFSPYINNRGTWMAANSEGNIIDTGTRAEGRDGIDGNAIRRIVVDSLPELPTNESEAKAFRGIYYLLSADTGYESYSLVETADGLFTWGKLGDTNAPASATEWGLTKLGTDAILTGSPVGTNASGGLTVGSATYTEEGVVRKTQSLVDGSDTDVPTVKAARTFLEQNHYTKTQVDAVIASVSSDIESVDGRLVTLASDVDSLSTRVYGIASDIATVQEEVSNLPTDTEVNNAINEASNTLFDKVKNELFVELTAEEYASITPEPGVIYLIPEE